MHVVPALDLWQKAMDTDDLDRPGTWIVQNFVRSPRVPPQLIEQAAQEQPERLEKHLRRAFCDSSIQLGRDLPGILRKYKGMYYRPGLSPDLLTALMPQLDKLTGEPDEPTGRIILPGQS